MLSNQTYLSVKKLDINVKLSHKDANPLVTKIHLFKKLLINQEKNALETIFHILRNPHPLILNSQDALTPSYEIHKKQIEASLSINKLKSFIGDTTESSPPFFIFISTAKILLDATEEAILEVEAINPELIEILAPISYAVDIMNAKWPNLTNEDLDFIYTLPTSPTDILRNYLTEKEELLYWNRIKTAFTEMTAALQEENKKIEENLSQQETLKEGFSRSTKIITSAYGTSLKLILAFPDKVDKGAEEGSKLVSLFFSLEQIPQIFSDDELNFLNSSIGTLLQTTICSSKATFKGETIADYIGFILSYSRVGEYLSSRTNQTANDIKVFLNELKDSLSNYRYGNLIIAGINKITSDNGAFENSFLDNSNRDNVKLSEKFYEKIFSPSGNSSASPYVERLFSNFEQQSNTYLSLYDSRINNLKAILDIVNPASPPYSDAYRLTDSNLIRVRPLGLSFSQIIIQDYIPKQNRLLQPLIESLNFNNMGSQIVNSIIKTIAGFGDASVFYNFSSFLVKSGMSPDAYWGSYPLAAVSLSSEKQRIKKDLTSLKQALSLTSTAIERIQNNSELAPSEKQYLLNDLVDYKELFETGISQILNLQTILNQIVMKPISNDENYFEITGPTSWESLITSYENYVVNGFSDITPSGGLTNIFSRLESDQQNFTNQSQTEQLNLQTQMTSIQQEWTIISTSLQILNQILSLLAQRANPL